MKQLELFSGVGGFRQASELLELDFGVEFKTVGYSEIDPNAKKTYNSVFDTTGEMDIGDIVEFNSDESNIRSIPNISLITGGFPCQPFSMMGKQKGFDDDRGNLFFEIMKIVRIKKPRYILLENVKNLKTHDSGDTLSVILNALESANYNVKMDIFNTSDYGLAQTRNRIYIFAYPTSMGDIEFSNHAVKAAFDMIQKQTSIIKQNNTHEVLSKSVDAKYFLSDRIKPTILANGSKNFQSRSEINQLIARPLTATMAKMHRACQDNYFSIGYIESDNPETYVKKQFSKEELARQSIRRITPREAFALQGFDSVYFDKVEKSGVSDCQLYKQAGNAVSVNTVYAILYYLFVHLQLSDE